MRQVALVYDDRQRPETTGNYCLRALRELVQVQHVLPDDLGLVPRKTFDLYLAIDDGLRYHMPVDLRPTAWWAIDTHMDFDWSLERAHHFDLLFAAQRDGALRLRDEGISAHWLPLACDPSVHGRHDVPKVRNVCFIGNLFPGPRSELLELIQHHFPDTFVGRLYFEAMARAYSESRVVFNRSIRNDINMRVFEALASGSLLLTNDLRDNGQEELFKNDTHLATYISPEEMLDKLRYYLRHEEERERVAQAGRREVISRHTYRVRMEALLGMAEKILSPKTVALSAETPQIPNEFVPTDQRRPPAAPTPKESVQVADPFYFGFARPEVVALVPREARNVLDIGCGVGRLGEAIKARQTAEVIGIETVEAAAREAKTRLDHVLVGDVERMELPFKPATFDAVICADVLEHLREPERLLRQARDWLRPGGLVIASIPNVRHHSMVQSLLDGNWTAEAAGLLDHAHLRFFTRRSIEALFRDSGFTVTKVEAVPGPGYDDWRQRGKPGRVQAGRLVVAGLAPEEAEEFFIYQYLVTATPAQPPESASNPPTSVIKETTSSPRRMPSPRSGRRLCILFLGDFGRSWRHEAEAANVLERLGHEVTRLHEYLMPSSAFVAQELDSGRYNCLLFYKGRIGVRSLEGVFTTTGEEIADVLGSSKIPAYTWYVDRALGFDLQPSREAWMRRVAPLCRVAFVADAALAKTNWARWHVLREPVAGSAVQKLFATEERRKPLAFVGQVYGERARELKPVEAEFPLDFISGVYRSALSEVLPGYKIILGPSYPTVPGFWGNRLYVVLGHGGFFLAPEVEGMREEGFVPGVHYAPLGHDPVRDIRHWLARAAERDRIARAGQDLVLARYTYEALVPELCRVIEETL